MKKIKFYALCLLATAAMFGCSKYDDSELKNDVNDLKSRVEKLETWCNTANGQISALQGLVTALEKNDYVSGVTPIMEGAKEVGYTIAFTKSKSIAIMHGKNGAQGEAGKDGITPIIGVQKDTDGLYYWTIQMGEAAATWMKDAEGNKIRTTGDKGADGQPGTDGSDGADGQPGTDGNDGADGQPGTDGNDGADGQPGADGSDGADGHSPVLSVATFEGRLYWQIDGRWLLNGENKVPATGDKGNTGSAGSAGSQGDGIFAKDGIDYTTDPANVIFTLADGTTKITLPKASTVAIGFDRYDTFYCSETDNQIVIALPATLKESDYNAIVATTSNENGTGMDIKTRAAASESTWGVEVIKPTFTNGTLVTGSAKIKLTLPQNKTNYKALLKVTLIDAKGKEHSASRVVWLKANANANVIDNATGRLSGKIADPTNVKQLSIIGSVNEEDFKYIRENLTSMEVLDLSRTSITSLPVKAMAFYSNMGLTNNTTLRTVVLPDGLTAIGNSAFAMCENLTEINIPKSTRTLGKWMFEGCSSIEEVKLPEGITEIPASAFYGAGIKRITIPSSVTTIGAWAFNTCNRLESVTIPATVTSLGENVFSQCVSLKSADILANVDALPNSFFMNSQNLTSVKLSTSIKTLEPTSFCNTGLTEFTIPNHISMIKEGAFSENLKLHTITLPAGVQMKWSVFNGCTNLKSVSIPEGVTELGAEIFRGCTALESVELPSTITSIRDRAFQSCSALKVLTCKATTPPILSGDDNSNYNYHFLGINSSCVLKRPAGSDYSGWSNSFKGGIQDL